MLYCCIKRVCVYFFHLIKEIFFTIALSNSQYRTGDTDNQGSCCGQWVACILGLAQTFDIWLIPLRTAFEVIPHSIIYFILVLYETIDLVYCMSCLIFF